LAVPMTMMVRTVLLEGSPETEPLALLLRSGVLAVRANEETGMVVVQERQGRGPAPDDLTATLAGTGQP